MPTFGEIGKGHMYRDRPFVWCNLICFDKFHIIRNVKRGVLKHLKGDAVRAHIDIHMRCAVGKVTEHGKGIDAEGIRGETYRIALFDRFKHFRLLAKMNDLGTAFFLIEEIDRDVNRTLRLDLHTIGVNNADIKNLCIGNAISIAP